MLKRMIRLELRKALKNKWFYGAIFIGCAITMLSFADKIDLYQNGLLTQEREGSNPMQAASGLFNLWIGGEPFSLGGAIYFLFSHCLRQSPMDGPTVKRSSVGISGWQQCAVAGQIIFWQSILLFLYPAGLQWSFLWYLISC